MTQIFIVQANTSCRKLDASYQHPITLIWCLWRKTNNCASLVILLRRKRGVIFSTDMSDVYDNSIFQYKLIYCPSLLYLSVLWYNQRNFTSCIWMISGTWPRSGCVPLRLKAMAWIMVNSPKQITPVRWSWSNRSVLSFGDT